MYRRNVCMHIPPKIYIITTAPNYIYIYICIRLPHYQHKISKNKIKRKNHMFILKKIWCYEVIATE